MGLRLSVSTTDDRGTVGGVPRPTPLTQHTYHPHAPGSPSTFSFTPDSSVPRPRTGTWVGPRPGTGSHRVPMKCPLLGLRIYSSSLGGSQGTAVHRLTSRVPVCTPGVGERIGPTEAFSCCRVGSYRKSLYVGSSPQHDPPQWSHGSSVERFQSFTTRGLFLGSSADVHRVDYRSPNPRDWLRSGKAEFPQTTTPVPVRRTGYDQ